MEGSAWWTHQRDGTVLTHAARAQTGVEDLTFQFKDSTYPGHLIENGYNTLGVFGCYNCWFRRLGFLNIDIGLHVRVQGAGPPAATLRAARLSRSMRHGLPAALPPGR